VTPPELETPEYARGRVDATLESHEARLKKINGSIDGFVKMGTGLAKDIRSLAEEIRTLQENGRISDARVVAAATALAAETEKRREELATTLANSDRKFSKRERIVALAIALAAVLVTLYFSLN
jgi:hypothetical protein